MSGINFIPMNVKYKVPSTHTPKPNGVIPKNPNGVNPKSAIALAALAFEPTPTSVTKPPNCAPNNNAINVLDGPHPAERHIAVTSGAIAVITPMFEHIELNAHDTISVARTMLRSLLPVSFTIFAPIMSVTSV